MAAFAGGIFFGAATKRRLREPVRFTETVGLSATFLVWSIFGALFVGELVTHRLSAQPIVYAVLSLTVIRMVPVAVALIGTRLRPATVAFMGWFGPRGLASVVFTLLAVEEFEYADGGALLVQTATWTILLSVVLHGLSASPLADRYGASIGRAALAPENESASEPRIRLRDLATRRGSEEHPDRRRPADPPGRHDRPARDEARRRSSDSRTAGGSARQSSQEAAASMIFSSPSLTALTTAS